MKLHDLLDRDLFRQAQADGHIRQQTHPTEPLAILNYTEPCAYARAWNPVTLACRGLIYNTQTEEIVARPWRKFFNVGEQGAARIPIEGPVQVTDKMDGSLGILYRPPNAGGWAIATRGSFSSAQAIYATVLLNTFLPRTAWCPDPGWTYLFEIIYRANRIVVDYGQRDELVLLGAIHTESGRMRGPDEIWWPGPKTTVFDHATYAAALGAAPRPNAEGMVVRDLITDAMVKIKQDDYVALHRIVTGLSARTVWQHLVDGKPVDELLAPLPEEFHPWVRDVVATLETTVTAALAEATKAHEELVDQLPDGWTRRDFAQVAVKHPLKWVLFYLLDGRDPRPELLKHSKPEPGWTPSGRQFTEDNA